ncbi:MAG: hypothetical protein K5888_07090 [Lachnospiraceae bacterium]|nr:hypothetical protein [Lachnospiraceae bacterium]
MINDEIRFTRILEDVKSSARMNGGFINEEEVKKAFEELDLSGEQFSMVFDYLRKNNIGIGEPLSESEQLDQDERNILEEYKNELSDLDIISESEREAFAIGAMAGEEEAKQKLLLYYLPKVVEISRLYSTQGVPVEDLIGEGNLALAEGLELIGALEKPEEIEGMLIKLVMDAMEESINEAEGVRRDGTKLADKVNEVADAARELAGEYGRKVTEEELADGTGLSLKKIREAVKLSGRKIEDIEYKDEEA